LISKNLKLGQISTKKALLIFLFFKKLKEWGPREASFSSFCSIFYPLSNGVLVKSIRVHIKKLQSFKNFKKGILAKCAIINSVQKDSGF